MNKTAFVIVVLIALSLTIYMIVPEGIPQLGTSSKLMEQPREGNGMLGRFMSMIEEMSWNPYHLFAVLAALVFVSAGMVIYWRGIQD